MESDNILRCGVKIVHSKNLISDIGAITKEFYNIGNLCVIYDNNSRDIADKIIIELRNVGYIVYDSDVYECNIPECVRYILGIGDECVSNTTKRMASEMDVPYSLFITTPSSESFPYNFVVEKDEYILASFPDAILYDDDIIERAGDRFVASGYGRVVSQLVSIFDMEFRRLVFSEKTDDETLEKLTEDIHRFEIVKSQRGFNLRLMELLLKIGDNKVILDIRHESVDEVGRLISDETGILFGEASFISAFMILNIYKFFLSYSAVDTMIPIDILKNLKLLEKMHQINYNTCVYKSISQDVSLYMKNSFVLDEYKSELLSKIDGIDMDEFARFWRRLYDDAGFWMKTFSSGQELLRYLSLSAELSEGSLLKLIKRVGFFERLI